MTTNDNQNPTADGTHRVISWKSPEILGELILLGIMLALMIVFVFETINQKEAGRYLPTMALIMGVPFWIARLVTVLGRKKAIQQGLVMDLGFRIGEDPVGERRRAIQYFGSILLLIAIVWGVGFHIGLPIWVMSYLAISARLKWYWVLLVGVAFESFVVGILDLMIDIGWPDPYLFSMFNIEYFFNELFTRVY